MRQFLLATLMSAVFVAGACAQQTQTRPAPIEPSAVVNVWPGVAPGSERVTLPEIVQGDRVRNVSQPTLTVFLPERSRATGAAVIIAPGGGFRVLNMRGQGADVARWFASRGIAAFVLKYRTVPTPVNEEEFRRNAGGEAPQADVERSVADGEQAIALVRARAAEWNINPQRVGILGFSAGALVAEGALLLSEPAKRPAFAGLIYGGIYREGFEMPRNLPPVFAAVAVDDGQTMRSMGELVTELVEAGARPEFHVFSGGGHGFGVNPQGTTSDHWIESFHWWLEAHGFLQPPER
jgi:acetyl esterase/lipase